VDRRYSVQQAVDWLGKGNSTLNRDVKPGLVTVIREGARVYVRRWDQGGSVMQQEHGGNLRVTQLVTAGEFNTEEEFYDVVCRTASKYFQVTTRQHWDARSVDLKVTDVAIGHMTVDRDGNAVPEGHHGEPFTQKA
jgi:hypothetical protein